MKSRYEINENKRKEEKAKKKRGFLKKFFIFLIIVLILTCLYGKFVEPNILAIKEYNIQSDDIPDSFEGVKLVQFSDLHYGIGKSEYKLKNMIDKINSLNPDIVVFTGDLIDRNYSPTDEDVKLITNSLAKINANLGKYACIGDHDVKSEHLDNIMYNSDFKILKNNYDTVYNKTNKPILLYGLDNVTYGTPKMDMISDKEIDNIPYKIVILHEPDYVDEFIDNYDVNLILAGHSHNGQAKLPKIRPIYLPKGAKTYYGDSYKINNSELYISNGVGNSIIDFRLFDTPSISLFRFTK